MNHSQKATKSDTLRKQSQLLALAKYSLSLRPSSELSMNEDWLYAELIKMELPEIKCFTDINN